MKTIPIIAQPDHVNSVTKSRNPIHAIAELVWNALDAEADNIAIETVENEMGGLESIVVKDDGFSLPYEYAFQSFGSLGGSWKREKERTDVSRRKIHGRNGKGRFQAFSLGCSCDWIFTYEEGGQNYQYCISGTSSDLATFAISDDRTTTSKNVGAVVSISDIHRDFPSFKRERATRKLAEIFALFLTEYPDVRISFDGQPVSPESVIADTVNLDVETEDSVAEISIIEWKMNQEHSMMLCNADGFVLRESKPRIHTPGWKNWTAYVKSGLFEKLDKENRLDLDELDSELEGLLSAVKSRIRQHFKDRELLSSEILIEEWKMEGLYPYSDVELATASESRFDVFDTCALSMAQHLPGFERSSGETKRFAFLMLKEVLEENPAALRTLFLDTLSLPNEKRTQIEGALQDLALSV